MLTQFQKPVRAERTLMKTQESDEISRKEIGIMNLLNMAKNALSGVRHFAGLICLSICQSVCLSVCLPVCLYVCLLFGNLFVYLSF